MFRRLAHANSSSAASSPRSTTKDLSELGSPMTPKSPLAKSSPNGIASLSSTPRTQISHTITPDNSVSLSASKPFDWEAARLRKPPPYASPLQGARARATRKSEAGLKRTAKRVIRKQSFLQKITSIPSRVMFEISMFPDNIPIPEPRFSAWLLGGAMHFTHLCIRISQGRRSAEEDLPWVDSYENNGGSSWFDWTIPMTAILVLASFFATFRLFTRIRIYSLHHRSEKVNSSHATFVSAQLDRSPLEPEPVLRRVVSWMSYSFFAFWRFLLNLKPPAPKLIDSLKTERVQQLSVWTPGELELHLVSVYSPAHSLLWMATTGSNWILMFTIMGIFGLQTHMFISSYEGLIKDKAIIAAEVMHEYDQKFVIPRINPIRKDAAVMTHEAEVITF